MSEDNHGLDKAARLAAKQEEEPEAPVFFEPEFPYEVVAFDAEFWMLAAHFDEVKQAAPPPGA
jgi:hypothetical protein